MYDVHTVLEMPYFKWKIRLIKFIFQFLSMIIYIDVDLVSTVVDSQRKPVSEGGGILRISNTECSKFRITLKTTY